MASPFRIAGALAVAALVMSLANCSDQEDALEAATREVTVTGDGCAAQRGAPPGGPSPGPIVEPAADRGEVVWSVDDVAGGEVQAFTASDDVVFVSTGTAVSALGVIDGQRRWRQEDVDVSGLRTPTPLFEDRVRTEINPLAIGEVLAAGAVEQTNEGEDAVDTSFRSAVIAFDPATGARRWTSKTMTGRIERIVDVDDVVIADTLFGKSVTAQVWVFDAATGVPKWRTEGLIAGAGDDTVFVYDENACLLHALALDGSPRWSVPTTPMNGNEIIPVQVEPDGDGVIMVLHHPVDGPVVVGRVDAVTGADVWRFQLPPTGGFGGVDLAVDGPSLQVVVEHVYESAPGVNEPPLLDVFDLDPRTGVARWAIQIPQDELTPEQSHERYRFSTESSLELVPAGFNIRISTLSLGHVLDASDGGVRRMFELQRALATVASGDFMESITMPQGIVAAAGGTVALIR